MLLATGDASHIEEHYVENQLIILNASREDLLTHILQHHPRKVGLIFAGKSAPSKDLIEALDQEEIPAIFAKMPKKSATHYNRTAAVLVVVVIVMVYSSNSRVVVEEQ